MDLARTIHALGYASGRVRQLMRSVGFWFLELLMLASSYGLLLTFYTLWETRGEIGQASVRQVLTSPLIRFSSVVLVAFMNFIWTGYIFTSLIARLLCVNKHPRLYPLILPCLVTIHITIILLKDHGWDLSISYPAFVGWGAATAFVTAWFSVKLENSRTRVVSDTR